MTIIIIIIISHLTAKLIFKKLVMFNWVSSCNPQP